MCANYYHGSDVCILKATKIINTSKRLIRLSHPCQWDASKGTSTSYIYDS